MRITDKLRGQTGRAQKNVGGRVGRQVGDALRNSPETLATDPVEATNTEQLLSATSAITALKNDSSRERKIVKAQTKVVKAAGSAKVAAADFERAQGADLNRRRLRGIAEQDSRQAETLASPIDHARALVSRWVVTIAEVLLGLVESGFWYLVFSADIDRRVSILSTERIAAIGLALFIPVLGILAARLAGPAWQRVLRYPATKQHLRRNQVIAAAVSAVLLAAAGLAAWFLVSWRYSSSNPSNALAVTPPGWTMALLFVGSVVTLALLRAFGESEQDDTNKRRDADVVSARKATKAAHDGLASALVTWAVVWTELRQLLNVGLNEIEQIYATGEYILLANRGTIADSARTRPAPLRAEDTDGVAKHTPKYHLNVNLFTPQDLRVHSSGLQTLLDYRPPALQPTAEMLEKFPSATKLEVDTLKTQVHALLGDLNIPTQDDSEANATNDASVDGPSKAAKDTPTAEVIGSPSKAEDNTIGTNGTSTKTVIDAATVDGINGHDHRAPSTA